MVSSSCESNSDMTTPEVVDMNNAPHQKKEAVLQALRKCRAALREASMDCRRLSEENRRAKSVREAKLDADSMFAQRAA